MPALHDAALTDRANPNLTDGGQHSLFQAQMRDVYREFFDQALDLRLLRTLPGDESRLPLTGYPEGLPCWEVVGGAAALADTRFWHEYDALLQGFLDFYRSFFGQVSTRNADPLSDLYFPSAVQRVLLSDNAFMGAAKTVRKRCIKEPAYANAIRWDPAFKQLIYRNGQGANGDRLLVTISQNSIGNAITELLGVVVKRVPDADAYAAFEPALLEHLLRMRERLVAADLGESVATAAWGDKTPNA